MRPARTRGRWQRSAWSGSRRRPQRPAKHDLQVRQLRKAAAALAHPRLARLYRYCLLDLPPDREAIEDVIDGRHDENEYPLGLVTAEGEKKPAFHALQALLPEEAVAS